MSLNQKIEEINTALSALGINDATVRIKSLCNQSKVYINQKYFGIYDHSKKTFVD